MIADLRQRNRAGKILAGLLRLLVLHVMSADDFDDQVAVLLAHVLFS
jgi:hypothetical protein